MTTPKTDTTSTPSKITAIPERVTFVFTTEEGGNMYVDLTEEQAKLLSFLRDAGFMCEDVDIQRLDEVVHQTP